VELRPITAEDGALFEAELCDDAMMEHLGGAITAEAARATLQRQLDLAAAGDALAFVVVAQGTDVGSVAIWKHEVDGERTSEMGWMILPTFQGRGLGKAAVTACLGRALAGTGWGTIHAYPAVANVASNAICRTCGFELRGERAFEYADRPLVCNDWALDGP